MEGQIIAISLCLLQMVMKGRGAERYVAIMRGIWYELLQFVEPRVVTENIQRQGFAPIEGAN